MRKPADAADCRRGQKRALGMEAVGNQIGTALFKHRSYRRGEFRIIEDYASIRLEEHYQYVLAAQFLEQGTGRRFSMGVDIHKCAKRFDIRDAVYRGREMFGEVVVERMGYSLPANSRQHEPAD